VTASRKNVLDAGAWSDAGMLLASVHDPAGNGPVVLESNFYEKHLNGANGAHHNGGSGYLDVSQASAPKANGSAKTLRVGIVLSGGQAPGVASLWPSYQLHTSNMQAVA